MKKNRKIVTATLVTLMAFSTCVPAKALDTKNLSRISDSNRVKTSIETAKYVNSDVLILASGYSFADSLSATNVANKTGGKVVLVGENTDIYSEYKNQNIKKVYIVGGQVKSFVREKAKRLTNDIIILEGRTRYETNKKTLDEFGYQRVGVADGRNYPDALSSSALLKKENLGLMLVDGSKRYYTDKLVMYTFGAKGSVIQEGGMRLGGSSRHETNIAILKRIGNRDRVSFVNGYNYPDALSAINLVTANGSPVVLVGKGNNAIKEYLKTSKTGYIIGGEVSNDAVNNMLRGEKQGQGSMTGEKPNPQPNPNPNPQPNPPTPKPNQNEISLGFYNAVTGNKIGAKNVDKNSDLTKTQVPSGYKVLPNQKIDMNSYVFRLYVVPESYTIVDSLEKLDEITAKAIINQMEEKKDIAFAVTDSYRATNNISQDNYSTIKPTKSNAYLWAMGFSTEMSPKGDFIEDNGIFMKMGDIKYRISQEYFTGEKFDRAKHIEYINKGIEILKSIGVYENDSMSDMEKAQKITEWVWANSVYSPVIDNNNKDIAKKNRSPYAILEFKEGVCEGYSFATSFLYNIAGIRVNTNETDLHKWNRFKADGSWNKLDATGAKAGAQTKVWERALNYESSLNEHLYEGTIRRSVSDSEMDKTYDFMISNGYSHLK